MSARLKRMFGATQVQSAFELSSRVRMTPIHIRPVSLDMDQSQNDADPYPVKRDGPVLRVAHKKEKRRSCKASENAPPLLVVHEEKAEMTSRHADDCDGLQPVGVINRARRGSRTSGVVHSRAILRHLLAPRGSPRRWLSADASP